VNSWTPNNDKVIFIISRLVYHLQQPYLSRYYLRVWYSSLLCSQLSFNIWLCIIISTTHIDISSLLVTCSTILLHGRLLVYFPLTSRLRYKYCPRCSTNLFYDMHLFILSQKLVPLFCTAVFVWIFTCLHVNLCVWKGNITHMLFGKVIDSAFVFCYSIIRMT
jgi:hypothetical protein